MVTEKPRMICVVGRTCSGKDSLTSKAILNANTTLSNFLIAREDLNTDGPFKPVTSYTTRKMRPEETDGKEHYFITNKEYEEKYKDTLKLAYTEIGQTKYFVTDEQIKDMLEAGYIPVYIIDPNGLRNMISILSTVDTQSDLAKRHLYIIHIKAEYEERMARYISRSYKDKPIKSKMIKSFLDRDESEDENFSDFEKLMFTSETKDYNIIKPDITIDNTRPDRFGINVQIMSNIFQLIYNS